MTVFARTWNASYEAIPANGADASEGANRIRDLKSDIQVRGEVDHSWAGDADDGAHVKVTFVDPLAVKPPQANDETSLYTKDVNSTSELFFEDEAGNEVQLTNAGIMASEFTVATRMLFQQETAPTGWTIDATVNDYLLRLVDGSTQTFTTVASPGGSDVFTTAFSSSKATESYTLLIADIPAHNHTYNQRNSGMASAAGANSSAENNVSSLNTGMVGGGGGHAHDITLDPSFVDVIIAAKD